MKALSKTEYEKRRFAQANQTLADSDITAATLMALPGPFMQVCVNAGLALVVFFGAQRVHAGQIEPGVILAFLTYFNMIAMGVMGVSRIFMTMSRASASANRIDAILHTETNQPVLNETQAQKPTGGGFIRFEGVSFCYGGDKADGAGEEQREKALSDISFTIKKGESLGIIGPTGCGKSTIINLLMRFYDVDSGFSWTVAMCGLMIGTICANGLGRCFRTIWYSMTPSGKILTLGGDCQTAPYEGRQKMPWPLNLLTSSHSASAMRPASRVRTCPAGRNNAS